MTIDFNAKRENFKEFFAENHDLLLSAEKSFKNLIHLLLSQVENLPIPKLHSRLKERNDCITKFNIKYRLEIEKRQIEYEIKDYMTDLIGIRIICHYESDINKVVAILKDNFEMLELTNKTEQLYTRKDSFGYKGVHLDLKLNKQRSQLPEYKKISNFQFEVQVRSIVQDAWSEVDHKLKYKKSISEPLQRRVYNLAALFELADREFDSIKEQTNKELLEINGRNALNSETLDTFHFLYFMADIFKYYVFPDYKVEGFVAELQQIKPITFGDFQKIFKQEYNLIDKYANYREEMFNDRMNPFTFIRHVLYQHDQSTYAQLMFEKAKLNFDLWLTEHKL